jgi:hypothetical protein
MNAHEYSLLVTIALSYLAGIFQSPLEYNSHSSVVIRLHVHAAELCACLHAAQLMVSFMLVSTRGFLGIRMVKTPSV